MAKKKGRRRAVAGITAGVLLLSAAGAIAYWLIQGTGSGDARTQDTEALVVTAVVGVADLYPGGQGDLSFNVSNPNGFPVDLVEADFTGATVTSDTNSCGAADLAAFSFADATVVLSGSIAAGGDLDVTLDDAVVLANEAFDQSCVIDDVITFGGIVVRANSA